MYLRYLKENGRKVGKLEIAEWCENNIPAFFLKGCGKREGRRDIVWVIRLSFP